MFGRIRRRWRWCLRGLVLVPLALFALALLLTRTPVTRALLLPAIEHATGMEVAASSVIVRRDGVISVRGFRAELRRHGRLLEARRIDIDRSWRTGKIRGVTLVAPTLRVVREPDGNLNLGRIEIGGEVGGPPAELPELLIREGRIELVEALPSGLNLLKALRVDGALRADPLNPTGYRLALREGSGPTPLILKGTFGGKGLDITLDGADLASWPPETVPSDVRESYRALALDGKIGQTRFTYTDRDGIGVRMGLERVSLNLPIPREPDGPDTPMRLHGVSGTIDFLRTGIAADLTGFLEDLPVHVRLDYGGYAVDSEFDCEIVSEGFLIAKNPRLLPYAPPLAQYRLGTFSNPTASMDARIRLRRGAPTATGAAEVRFEGTMQFRDGEASFERFPYTFKQMEGVVRFDNDRVEIIRITGVADTGARLFAAGSFAPPDANPEVILDVRVTGAPLDEAIRRGLGPHREEILDALCNAEEYDRLRAAGLVQSSGDAAGRNLAILGERIRLAMLRAHRASEASIAGSRAAIESLEASAGRPIFDLGGGVEVNVRIRKPRGAEGDWQTTIDLLFPALGLVPRRFPLPIFGRDVRVIVDDHDARVIAGRFDGLAGGEATIRATLPMGEGEFAPAVEIAGDHVPVEPLLIHAISRLTRVEGAEKAARVLRELGVRGDLTGDIHIHDEGGSTRVTGDIDVTGWSGERRAQPRTVLIAGESGRLVFDEHTLSLALSGTTRLVEPAMGTSTGAGSLGIDLRVGASDVGVRVEGGVVDAEVPIESIVEVFSPETASILAAKRAEFSPRGLFDVIARVDYDGREARSAVTTSNASGLSFDTPAGRIALEESRGAVTISTLGEEAEFRFHEFEALARHEGRVAGRVQARGELSSGVIAGRADPAGTSRLELLLSGVSAESAFVREVAVLLGASREMISELDPNGVFGGGVVLRPRATGGLAPDARFTIDRLEGKYQDRPVALAAPGAKVSLRSDGGGRVESVLMRGEGWEAGLGAEFTPWGEGIRVRGEIDATAASLSPAVRDLLPRALVESIDAVSLRVEGPVALRGGRFDTVFGEDAATTFDGELAFQSAALEAGVTITDLDGHLTARYERVPEAPGGDGRGGSVFSLDVRGDRARAEGIGIAGANAMVTSGREDEILAQFWGASHGGRFSGEAIARPRESRARGVGEGAGTEYEVRTQLAGIGISSLMAELGSPEPSGRGLLDGEVSLAGASGEGAWRRGRGVVRMGGGEVVRIPLVMPLVEFGNLQLPLGEKLDYAEATFFVDGGTIAFEELSIFSSTIALFGYGTMTWPERRLDMDFRSKAARPIPIVSGMIEGLRDTLMITHVGGTLDDPSISLRRSRAEGRRIGGVVAVGSRDESMPLGEIERRARERRALRPEAE